jgi:hypothetical protein
MANVAEIGVSVFQGFPIMFSEEVQEQKPQLADYPSIASLNGLANSLSP